MTRRSTRDLRELSKLIDVPEQGVIDQNTPMSLSRTTASSKSWTTESSTFQPVKIKYDIDQNTP
jgi:hypothetical protein